MACHAPNLTALCPRLREWAEERHLAVAIPSPPDCISDFPEEHHSSPSLQEQRRLLLGSRCGTPRFLFRPASAAFSTSAASASSSPHPSATVHSGTARLMKLARCDLLGSRCGTPRRATGADPRAFHHRARSVTWDLPRDEIPFSHSNPVPSRGCLRLLRADVLGSKCGTPKFRAPAEPEAIWSV
ncbi:unnamed protein product [Closterium sp. NIES-64]|nr:unnamed protein product [Closterium sp. NIES-64]CAI6002682.1 unnamed protein product [Closterium sp. NIES-64]